jgi:hypothetical protein
MARVALTQDPGDFARQDQVQAAAGVARPLDLKQAAPDAAAQLKGA